MENFLNMKYELELNKTIKIFDNYYKFIILKQALSEIKNNLVKKYLLSLMKYYNNAIEIIVKYIPHEEENKEWIYDYFFEFYMNMLQHKLIELQMAFEIKNDNKAISVFSKLSNQGRVDDAKEYIKLKTKNKVDKMYAERYVSTLLISDIVDAIFKPVDESEDPKLESYIPFRLFATYLMSKGYDGIIYRSTRMDLMGEEGKNVVLFNKDDATYWENSMEVFHYGDDGYTKIVT